MKFPRNFDAISVVMAIILVLLIIWFIKLMIWGTK